MRAFVYSIKLLTAQLVPEHNELKIDASNIAKYVIIVWFIGQFIATKKNLLNVIHVF